MLMYRLESFHKKSEDLDVVNLGAYGVKDITDYALSDNVGKISSEQHPLPTEDDKISSFYHLFKRRLAYGFESMESLQNWFNNIEGMRYLQDHKIARIGIYEVKDEYYKIGRRQMVAIASELTLIDVIPCNSAQYL